MPSNYLAAVFAEYRRESQSGGIKYYFREGSAGEVISGVESRVYEAGFVYMQEKKMPSFQYFLDRKKLVEKCCWQKEETADPMEKVKIGVAIYNEEDQEVMAFRRYYEDYISKCFEVEFIYSGNIVSAEDELDFVKAAKGAGASGIISFVSYDLPRTVAACAEEELYYMMGSGTVSDEAFEAVKSNSFFLGVIGPDESVEREAGKEMAEYFTAKDTEKQNHYLIISGGGCNGNVMHQYRTEAILEGLAETYGLTYETPVEELAVSSEAVQLEQNGVRIGICPGYLSQEAVVESAVNMVQSGEYNQILGVLPLTAIYDTIDQARDEQELQVGVVDCFTERNMEEVERGNLQYVTGKYPSIIGPSFAAMFNAVTGYAEDFRDEGHAFRISQGFWKAENEESYREMYGLATGIYENAYDHEDLSGIMKAFNKDADFASLKAMTEAYRLEDIEKR